MDAKLGVLKSKYDPDQSSLLIANGKIVSLKETRRSQTPQPPRSSSIPKKDDAFNKFLNYINTKDSTPLRKARNKSLLSKNHKQQSSISMSQDPNQDLLEQATHVN